MEIWVGWVLQKCEAGKESNASEVEMIVRLYRKCNESFKDLWEPNVNLGSTQPWWSQFALVLLGVANGACSRTAFVERHGEPEA